MRVFACGPQASYKTQGKALSGGWIIMLKVFPALGSRIPNAKREVSPWSP